MQLEGEFAALDVDAVVVRLEDRGQDDGVAIGEGISRDGAFAAFVHRIDCSVFHLSTVELCDLKSNNMVVKFVKIVEKLQLIAGFAPLVFH